MKDCTTCRWYAYLTTLDIHLCRGACAGEIRAEDVPKGGDCWEPRQEEEERKITEWLESDDPEETLGDALNRRG